MGSPGAVIPLVYLDTNIFIAAFEMTGESSRHVWRVLQAAESGRISPVTSELTLAELLSKPSLDPPSLPSIYEDLIRDRPGLRAVPISRQILIEAAAIRRRTAGLKLPDALHLGTAVIANCTHFFASDLRLKSAEGLRVVHLSPTSLEDIAGAGAP
jgi:predicted nucleic acid-binding protein